MLSLIEFLFQLLEENMVTLVKNELKKIHKLLSPDYPECSGSQREDEEVVDGEDEEQRSIREALVKITVKLLRSRKQEELAERLQSSKRISLKIQHDGQMRRSLTSTHGGKHVHIVVI